MKEIADLMNFGRESMQELVAAGQDFFDRVDDLAKAGKSDAETGTAAALANSVSRFRTACDRQISFLVRLKRMLGKIERGVSQAVPFKK